MTRGCNSKACVPVARRNERERTRVKLLNLGFARLRAVVPSKEGEQLSKISTLKKAIWYIEHLDRVLKEPLENDALHSTLLDALRSYVHTNGSSLDG
ncbi:unnamed protein product [Schistocephalus solidus]|uniref:BHLH domain-containing protein n=1 Tax=Schistocephalus solidus TaxID=70667 RepID=A0A183SCY7_SCHSO|nr:unnamed protein product [Schistocephalus solidus]